MKNWKGCRKILCVRADNMGDIIMSGPAIRALKESFDCSITLLTSKMGALISPCMLYIDEVITCNLPWIKASDSLRGDACAELIERLKKENFDAAVIFNAYSQSALPAAMLCFMAGIPLRLAYCRENPYELLTDWVPDKEPYTYVLHQVERDLALVKTVGARASNDQLFIWIDEQAKENCERKLAEAGIDLYQPYIIAHTGVSEAKREYPAELWVQALQMLEEEFHLPILLTGSAGEKTQAEQIRKASGGQANNIAGLLDIEEFVALISQARLVISVNTATIHIAAATQTPAVVLYAMTNPQHTPWKSPAQVLTFPVQDQLRSRNEVIGYVSNLLYSHAATFPMPQDIINAAARVLNGELVDK